jgi:transcriptional regulator with XRE-family HTH domain
MSDSHDDNRLGKYLRARRELVSPEQAGIPAGANRRVPGLRREEVAMLAGISADYYLRLERGRDKNPSTQVLEAIGRVLGLDEVEQSYLLGMIAPRVRTRRRHRPERVPARLHQLLATIGLPAFVEGRAFDVFASNDLWPRSDCRPSSRAALSTCSPPTTWQWRSRRVSGRARTGCARSCSTPRSRRFTETGRLRRQTSSPLSADK